MLRNQIEADDWLLGKCQAVNSSIIAPKYLKKGFLKKKYIYIKIHDYLVVPQIIWSSTENQQIGESVNT